MNAILILAVCLSAAPAETAGNSDNSALLTSSHLASAVRKLVRELDAPRLADREQAEADLLKLGPAALDLLPEADKRTSAETRQRLARIRQKLQEALAQMTAKPTAVTFHGKSVPLSKVLAAIEKQTGNKIVDLREKFGQPQTDPAIDVDLDETPFWQSLDKVLDKAGMAVYPYAMEPAVSIVTRSDAAASDHIVYSGPFRIEPLAVTANRDLREKGNRSLQVKLQLGWEPRLAPISLRQRFADLRAVDENGRPLPANDSGGDLEVQVNRDETAVEMFLPLALPSREVKKIASLDAAIEAILPGKTATFRFDKLTESKKTEKRIGGVTVTFERARRNGEIWEIAVSVRFDKAGDALESHRGWIFNNEAYLKTPEGKKIKDDGFETTLQTEDQVGLTYLFALKNPPDRMTFVYKTPTAILSARFAYRLKDIPLP